MPEERFRMSEKEILKIHRGGKVAMVPRVGIPTLRALRMVYTPGVAQVCAYIQNNPRAAREYTSIGNTVCIATNGSAVLGLGNIGVWAGMPVMEGKSVIVHTMAGASCVPLLIESSDPEYIVDVLAGVSRTFSLIMIEDIAAPLCFQVEEALQKRVEIPVFHDDQHGTATVVLSALLRVLTLTRRKKEDIRIVINGAGAAGIATAKMLLEYGFAHLVLCDKAGALYQGRTEAMNVYKQEIAGSTNREKQKGVLAEVMADKDVFIGLSGPNLVTGNMVKRMNKNPIVFAMANPVPEIRPDEALNAGAVIALDGKVINNALVFPGIIRGTLDARASRITYPMKFKAAETIASLAKGKAVVPDFMDLAIHKRIARAVAQAASMR